MLAEIDSHFGYADLPVNKRHANGILCRSDNHLGAVFRGGVKNPREITCRVSVMVRKAKRFANPYSGPSKVLKKTLGPGNSGESDSLAIQERIRSKIGSPFLRLIPLTLCRQAKTGMPGKRRSSLYLSGAA